MLKNIKRGFRIIRNIPLILCSHKGIKKDKWEKKVLLQFTFENFERIPPEKMRAIKMREKELDDDIELKEKLIKECTS